MVKEEVHVRWGRKDPLVVGNEVFISSNVSDLTEKDVEKAHIELGETEEGRRRCLQELKSRLLKEGRYRADDSYLLRYLRVRKFDVDKAYENVKKFYNMRKKNFDIYIISSKLRSLEILNFCTCLPYTDEEGRIIFWMDIEFWNPKELSFVEIMQHVTALCDVVLSNPKCQVNGVIGICDVKGLSSRHVSEALEKNRLMSIISIAHFAAPWRINKVLILNTSRLTRFAYSLIRPMLTKKVSQRVFLLGSDLNELHQYVNPAILPKKLGGELEDDVCQEPKIVLDNILHLEYDRSFTGE